MHRVHLWARRLRTVVVDPFGMFGNPVKPAQGVGFTKHLRRADHAGMFAQQRPATVPQREAANVGKQPGGRSDFARFSKGCGNGPGRSG